MRKRFLKFLAVLLLLFFGATISFADNTQPSCGTSAYTYLTKYNCSYKFNRIPIPKRREKPITDIKKGDRLVRRVFKGNTLAYSKTYTQTYHINGQTFSYMVPIDCDAVNWIDIANLTPSGYTFVGWRTDSQANPTVLNKLTVTDNNNLYAVFKRNISVTIKGGKSDVVNTGVQYINNGNKSNPNIKLEQSQSDGLTLVGYRTDKQASSNIQYLAGQSYQFSDNTTLYAVFAKEITVTLQGGQSPVYNKGNIYYNNGNTTNPQIKLGTSTIGGWNLLGYRTDAQATGQVQYSANATYAFNSNTTLYAVFNRTLTLSYNGNGATSGGVATQTGTQYYNNGNFANPTVTISGNGFARTGCRFDYWYTGSTTVAAGNSITISDNTTLYAHWTTNSYTLTLDNNDGTAPTRKSVNYGSTFGELPSPSKNGYNFDGWFTDPTNGERVSSSTTMGDSDITIYAHWSLRTYTIEFELDGGTMGWNTVPQNGQYTINNGKFFFDPPTKEGYRFLNWSVTSTTKPEINWVMAGTVYCIPGTSDGWPASGASPIDGMCQNLKFKANWEKIEEVVIAEFSGGGGYERYDYNLEEYMRQGYTYAILEYSGSGHTPESDTMGIYLSQGQKEEMGRIDWAPYYSKRVAEYPFNGTYKREIELPKLGEEYRADGVAGDGTRHDNLAENTNYDHGRNWTWLSFGGTNNYAITPPNGNSWYKLTLLKK